MLNLLTYVVEFIKTIVSFVQMAVTSIVNLIRIIPTFISYVLGLFDWLPDIIKIFAVLGLSISVVLFLLGRDTN